MKLTADDIMCQLGTRIGDGDHLVAEAVEHYKGARSTKRTREWADRNRVHYAKEGKYLTALIHDQIYRICGGED